MALQHAEYLANRMPRTSSGLSADKLYMRTVLNPLEFQQLHVWGWYMFWIQLCKMGESFPSGNPDPGKANMLASHLCTLSTVHLVINLSTGKIGPQYHVVFDKWFETVMHLMTKHLQVGSFLLTIPVMWPPLLMKIGIQLS